MYFAAPLILGEQTQTFVWAAATGASLDNRFILIPDGMVLYVRRLKFRSFICPVMHVNDQPMVDKTTLSVLKRRLILSQKHIELYN